VLFSAQGGVSGGETFGQLLAAEGVDHMLDKHACFLRQ